MHLSTPLCEHSCELMNRVHQLALSWRHDAASGDQRRCDYIYNLAKSLRYFHCKDFSSLSEKSVKTFLHLSPGCWLSLCLRTAIVKKQVKSL